MGIVLYDLAGQNDIRFSPNCWRTKMALAHKGLAHDSKAVHFTEIRKICGGRVTTLPTIDDNGLIVTDSWHIAEHLEDTYPGHPSLFDGPAGRAYSRLTEGWVAGAVFPPLIGLIVADIHSHLILDDQAYFRQSREARFGKSLEDIQAGREARVDVFRAALQPARQALMAQPFLGGMKPLYPDYLVFGALQWSRVVSPLPLLAEDDAVLAWFRRCLDLFNSLGRTTPGYWD